MKTISQLTISLILIACPILGHATTYTYDDIGRLTSALYSNGDYINYSYDAAGNILTITSSSHGSSNSNAISTADNDNIEEADADNDTPALTTANSSETGNADNHSTKLAVADNTASKE